MILYLDTSSLFKLYQNEHGTNELDKLFFEENIKEIILSELSKVEFTSIVWKKIRMKDLSENQGIKLMNLFKDDYYNYSFVKIDNELVELSINLMNKYGNHGLRTLDSIQLATAFKYKDKIDLGKTSDKILNRLLVKIGIRTD